MRPASASSVGNTNSASFAPPLGKSQDRGPDPGPGSRSIAVPPEARVKQPMPPWHSKMVRSAVTRHGCRASPTEREQLTAAISSGPLKQAESRGAAEASEAGTDSKKSFGAPKRFTIQSRSGFPMSKGENPNQCSLDHKRGPNHYPYLVTGVPTTRTMCPNHFVFQVPKTVTPKANCTAKPKCVSKQGTQHRGCQGKTKMKRGTQQPNVPKKFPKQHPGPDLLVRKRRPSRQSSSKQPWSRFRAERQFGRPESRPEKKPTLPSKAARPAKEKPEKSRTNQSQSYQSSPNPPGPRKPLQQTRAPKPTRASQRIVSMPLHATTPQRGLSPLATHVKEGPDLTRPLRLVGGKLAGVDETAQVTITAQKHPHGSGPPRNQDQIKMENEKGQLAVTAKKLPTSQAGNLLNGVSPSPHQTTLSERGTVKRHPAHPEVKPITTPSEANRLAHDSLRKRAPNSLPPRAEGVPETSRMQTISHHLHWTTHQIKPSVFGPRVEELGFGRG
ncbi:nascent polypeptide-associated complex subunit alpha, muscle-specific form-like [Penaeus chinensis]|uniref:nascent polypeptide-associated complex subunit alpha, muscle-specific form-like n=1 Tax=Penaeus chinensis TaxID=139456 RepID=UPI001FB651C6|nr:nascent polypeptide-associated complex subunit alpha, muscle-specific form-like [Penaeus chinensis]